MQSIETIAGDLADEWLEMFTAISWFDHAASIRSAAPFPAGETTSIKTPFGLLDVSDSQTWIDGPEGDIMLTIEVYRDPEDPPLALRTTISKSPG